MPAIVLYAYFKENHCLSAPPQIRHLEAEAVLHFNASRMYTKTEARAK